MCGFWIGVICVNARESVDHLLLHYPVAKILWSMELGFIWSLLGDAAVRC